MVWLAAMLATTPVAAQHTNTAQRQEFARKLQDDIILRPLQADSSAAAFRSAFWGMYMFLQHNSSSLAVLHKGQSHYNQWDADTRYAFWLAAYTLWPDTFAGFAQERIAQEPHAKVAAAALQLLVGTDQFGHLVQQLPASAYKPRLQQQTAPKRPVVLKNVLAQLAQNPLWAGRKHLIALHATQRNHPGLVLILGADGQLLETDGRIAHYPQLARSATNLPYFLTNGNTPCGVYRIRGLAQSNNVFIGPSTTVHTELPFECSPADFAQSADSVWSEALYAHVLGTLAQADTALWQAYHAGQLGRSEIILHGSTIDPAFYQHTSFFPLTPSLGCLTALELWHEGSLQQSSQVALVDAFDRTPGPPGFLLVIDVHDLPRAVQPNDFSIL